MFPEHHTEFKHLKQEELAKFHVELIEDEYTPNYYEAFIELPFGTLTSKLVCKNTAEEDAKFAEVTSEKVQKTYKTELEPIPISMADQA